MEPTTIAIGAASLLAGVGLGWGRGALLAARRERKAVDGARGKAAEILR